MAVALQVKVITLVVLKRWTWEPVRCLQFPIGHSLRLESEYVVYGILRPRLRYIL